MKGTINGVKLIPDLWYVQSIAPPGDISQPRAAAEEMFRKMNISSFNQEAARYWLETCGSQSLVNGKVAVGRSVDVVFPTGRKVRSPDAVTVVLNDRGYYDELRKVRNDPQTDLPTHYMGNEIAQYLAWAGHSLFEGGAEFQWLKDFNKVADIVSQGCAVEISLLSPLHFLVVVAFDETTNELIYVDPAPYRHPNGDWYKARMAIDEYNKTVNQFSIIIS